MKKARCFVTALVSNVAFVLTLANMVHKAFLNIVLVSLYVYFFGIKSVKRFKEESIVTIKKSQDYSSSDLTIKPGLAILPIDPITGCGWKSLNASHLVNASESELKEGIEELAYLYDEIVVGSRHNVSHYSLLSTYQFGLVQVLETSGQSFTFSEQTSQSIALNNYPLYYLAFFDPTFAVMSGNPDTIPRTLVPIPSNAGLVKIYLRLILHLNLNHPGSPCRDPTGYNYASCINTWIAKSVGCQSFWSNLPGIPLCSDINQYYNYTTEYDRVVGMEKNELLATTGCVRPCQFMEYSLADDPLYTVSQNQTNLTIMFSSSSVLIETEQKAFSFGSFVADVGGVLGLFIGFSFINLWEFLIVWQRKLYLKCGKSLFK